MKLEQHLRSLQQALINGTVDRATYEALRNDLFEEDKRPRSNSTKSGDPLNDSLLSEAQELLNVDEYEKAKQLYTKILAERPPCHEALRGRAYCKLRLGELTGAMIDVRKSEQLLPYDPKSICLHAQLLFLRDEFADAVALLDRAIRHNEPDAQLLHARGIALELGARRDNDPGKLVQALGDFKSANQLDPECEIPQYDAVKPSDVDWIAVRGFPPPSVISETPYCVQAIPCQEVFVNTPSGRRVQFYCGECHEQQNHPAKVIGRRQACVKCGVQNAVPNDVAQGALKAIKMVGWAGLASMILVNFVTASVINNGGGAIRGKDRNFRCPNCSTALCRGSGLDDPNKCPHCGITVR